MDSSRLIKRSDYCWEIPIHDDMRVPAIIYADQNLIEAMDDKVYQQAKNVATLPGIVQASYAMPDAHWGYGFPIGGPGWAVLVACISIIRKWIECSRGVLSGR